MRKKTRVEAERLAISHCDLYVIQVIQTILGNLNTFCWVLGKKIEVEVNINEQETQSGLKIVWTGMFHGQAWAKVKKVVGNSPASRAGVLIHDEILSINGEERAKGFEYGGGNGNVDAAAAQFLAKKLKPGADGKLRLSLFRPRAVNQL